MYAHKNFCLGIKTRVIWPYKGEALISHENFYRLEKSVDRLIKYVMTSDENYTV